MADTALAPGQVEQNKLLAGGFQPTEVQQWTDQRRSQLTQAGFSQQEVDDYFGVKKPDTTDLDTSVKTAVDPLYAAGAKPAGNLWEDFQSGLQMGASNLPFKRPDIIPAENAGLASSIFRAIGQETSDLPLQLFGFAGGALAGSESGPGALLTGAAGAGVLPETIRQASLDMYRKGMVQSPQDLLAMVAKNAWDIGVAGVTSAVGAGAGQLASKAAAPVVGETAAKLADPIAFTAASTATMAAFQKQMPSADDFISGAVLALGLTAAAHGTTMTMQGSKPQLTAAGETVKANLEDIWVKTGLTPKEALAAAASDPSIKAEILAPRDVDGNPTTPGLGAKATANGYQDPVEKPQPVPPQPKPAEGQEPPEPKAPYMKAEDVPQVHLDLVRDLENSADDAVSPAGAIGRYQIMPGTARQYGFDPTRLTDPAYNEQAARAILADLNNKFNGRIDDMLVAYNAGPGAARKWIANGRDFNSLPRETQLYLLHAEELGAFGHDATFSQADLSNQLHAQGIDVPMVPSGTGGGGGREPPLEGEVIPPEPQPRRIEGLVPEQMTLEDHMARLDEAIAPEVKPTLAERLSPVTQLLHALDTELAPFGRLDKKLGTNEAPVSLQDDFRNGIYGSVSRHLAFFQDGIVTATKQADGTLLYRQTGKASKLDAYRAVKEDGGNLKGFLRYWLAAHAVENAQRGIQSLAAPQLDSARALLTNKDLRAQYERGLQLMQESKNGVLDYTVANDLYSPERVEAMKDANPSHMNLRRAMDPSYNPQALMPNRARTNDPLRKQSGSERLILDPISNELDNQRSIVAMADMNHARLRLVDAIDAWNKANPDARVGLEKNEAETNRIVKDLATGKYLDSELIGPDGKPVPPEEQKASGAEPFLLAKAESGKLGRDHIIVYRNGVPEAWRATSPEMRDLLSIGGTMPDAVSNALTWAANIQRTGIVNDIGFAIRSVIHGAFASTVLAEGGRLPNIVAGVQGAMDAFGGGKALQDLRANGGDVAALHDINNRYLKEDIDQVFARSQTWFNVVNYLRDPLRALSAPVQVVHRTAEAGWYAQNRAPEADAVKTAMNARRAFIDRAEGFRNPVVSMMSRWLPFFSIAVKDQQQFMAALAPDRIVPTLAKGALLLTLPTLALAAYNAANEKVHGISGKDSVMNQPQWMQDLYWSIRSPDGKAIFQWRKPTSLLTFLFSVLPGRAMKAALGGQNPADIGSLFDTAKTEAIPTGVPTLLQPMLEQWANRSLSTGYAIVPAAVEKAHGYMQYGPNTTETAKAIARILGPSSPFPVDLSPYVIDNYIKDWLGPTPLNLLRQLGGPFNPDKPPKETLGADMPFWGSFFARNWGAGQALDDFYNGYAEYSKSIADMGVARKDSSPEAAARVQKSGQLDQIYKALGATNATIRATEMNAQLTPDEKRLIIDQIATKQYAFAQRGLAIMRGRQAVANGSQQ